MKKIAIASAENRAKAVLLTISGKSQEIQLAIILGAIRGATEQAARIVESHNDNDEFDTITKLIARGIRKTM